MWSVCELAKCSACTSSIHTLLLWGNGKYRSKTSRNLKYHQLMQFSMQTLHNIDLLKAPNVSKMQLQISFGESRWPVSVSRSVSSLSVLIWIVGLLVFPTSSDIKLSCTCLHFSHREFQFHVNSFAWADLKNFEKQPKQLLLLCFNTSVSDLWSPSLSVCLSGAVDSDGCKWFPPTFLRESLHH